MKIPLEQMLAAAAVLSEVPETKTAPSSQFIRITKREDYLFFRLASALEAAAWAQTDQKIGSWTVYISRSTFLQWLRGCRGDQGDLGLDRGDGVIRLSFARRRAKFPEVAKVSGYAKNLSGGKSLKLSTEAIASLKLASHYAGGEGVPGELQCLFVAGQSLLATNQLNVCQIDGFAAFTGPLPLHVPAYLDGQRRLGRNQFGVRVHLDQGFLFQPYDLASLRKFPAKRILRIFGAARQFPLRFALPAGPALEVLNRLQSFANKADREDLQVQIKAEKSVARFTVGSLAGTSREEIDCVRIVSSAETEILIPSLLPLLRYIPEDYLCLIGWEDESSPFYVTAEAPDGARADVHLLITRRIS